jgi:hypothetical protein
MGHWSRDELERAFARYQEVAAEAGRTGDWNAWADLFTEDCTYIEHLYGEMEGREAVRAWITRTMTTPPGSDMDAFPVEWYVIDEERGWIVMCVWNRFRDPGDGAVFQAYNFSLLKYAGDGMWSYEEDIYNPAAFGEVLEAWTQHGKALAR